MVRVPPLPERLQAPSSQYTRVPIIASARASPAGGHRMIQRILILGGGSAGFLAAISLKVKIPDLQVSVVRSRDMGVIGVGEATTFAFPNYLHGRLHIEPGEFHRNAQPTWKLGIRFLNWGPRRHFDYTFRPQVSSRWENLPRPNGYYCYEDF